MSYISRDKFESRSLVKEIISRNGGSDYHEKYT